MGVQKLFVGVEVVALFFLPETGRIRLNESPITGQAEIV